MEPDVYFKKIVTFEHEGRTLTFRVAQDLFSSHDVDVGTRRLLRTLGSAERAPWGRILDLGCGYGPIGLTLKKLHADCIVHMVDRDALALEYARQNAELNGLSGLEIYGSLGYDDVRAADFDLIISNIPGKAGESAIAHFLKDAGHYLRPGGTVAVVVVTPLEPTVARILDDPSIHILLRQAWSGHTVFHYQFSHDAVQTTWPREEGALERGVYHRESLTVYLGELSYPMRTAHGLPEFDTLSYRSELLLEGILRLQGSTPERALVFNPGQGHVPVAVWTVLAPGHIALVDRDLLSLRYSENNLVLNGCPADRVTLSHQVGLLAKGPEQADLIVGILREDEGPAGVALTMRQAARQLSPEGTVLVAGSSTAVTRLERVVRAEKLLTIRRRKRTRGTSLLVMTPSASRSKQR
jgi:16S rRNA (guanine1207-N2)-methyltransferase